jgi:protein-disulfide isomerase
VIPELIKQYVDTGKARYVYREFPLTQSHPAAQKASEAAICAGKQGGYWEMNEHIFANVEEWSQGTDPTDSFKSYAGELGLDTAAFDECLDSGETATDVQADLMAGQVFGVDATPYFFINDLPIRGGLPIESLGSIIDYVAAGGTQPEIIPSGDDWHVRGNLNTATAVTLAFVDYSNPESAQHAREVLPALMEQYVDSGQMIYVLHPWSSGTDSPGAQAAIAAECAGEQGEYWEMHDLLFDKQDEWTGAEEPNSEFAGYAESLDLDSDKFEECLDSDWAFLRAQSGNVLTALRGWPGAPLFLFNNGQGQPGSPTLEEFQTIIDSIVNQ